MSHADHYDYVVINDNFEKAVKEIQKIIKKEYLKRLGNEGKEEKDYRRIFNKL